MIPAKISPLPADGTPCRPRLSKRREEKRDGRPGDELGTTSWESVATAEPDFIILLDYQTGSGADSLRRFLENHPLMKQTPAVKRQRYLKLQYAELTPGPANINAAEKLAHAMYPAAPNERDSLSLLLGRVGALPLLAGLMLLSVAKGSVPLSLTQVLGALRLLDVPVSEMIGRIVIDLRVPRTLLAVLAGAVLAIVGGLLQTTTRNDLADPFYSGFPPAHRRERYW